MVTWLSSSECKEIYYVVVCVMTLCSLVGGYQSFGGTSCNDCSFTYVCTEQLAQAVL
jgi:hypothetical protein